MVLKISFDQMGKISAFAEENKLAVGRLNQLAVGSEQWAVIGATIKLSD